MSENAAVRSVTTTTADYGTIITAVGSAKIASGILHGTKLNITHAAVGDGGGGYYKPTIEQTSLINEHWRGEIANCKINEENANMLDIKFIVPAEVGGFTVREAALFDADGDMVAICNTPDAQKVAITDGVSFPLKMLLHIIVTDASVVSVSVNPSLDIVNREEMEAALKAHNDDRMAHGGILRVQIGGVQPFAGPTLWFDTADPATAPEILLLELGPLTDDAEVTAEINGVGYSVTNVGVNNAPTEDKMSLTT